MGKATGGLVQYSFDRKFILKREIKYSTLKKIKNCSKITTTFFK